MGIFDDVVVNAKSAAEAVGKKAASIVDISKLKITYAELNGEISKRYTELGQFVYENASEEMKANPEIAGRCAEIDYLISQTESVNKEILAKQNKKVCEVCGAQSDVTSAYCSVCGAKLPEEEIPVEEPVAEAVETAAEEVAEAAEDAVEDTVEDTTDTAE